MTWPSLAIAILGALAALGPPVSAVAQRGSQPRISVSATIVADPASQVLLAIEISPSGAVPKHSFLRLRGLPPGVSLTEGYAIGGGSWAVPLFALPTLKANIPVGVTGRTEISISLVVEDGTLLAETRTALVVGQSALAPPSDKAPAELLQNRLGSVASPSPVLTGRPDRNSRVAPSPPELSTHEKARSEHLLAQGETYLAHGKVEAARQFFERAAEIGLAAAALRLAETYDPAELERLDTRGVVPDRALARQWYERAEQLGAPEAEKRLARLGGG
jgi:hypothetical protein